MGVHDPRLRPEKYKNKLSVELRVICVPNSPQAVLAAAYSHAATSILLAALHMRRSVYTAFLGLHGSSCFKLLLQPVLLHHSSMICTNDCAPDYHWSQLPQQAQKSVTNGSLEQCHLCNSYYSGVRELSDSATLCLEIEKNQLSNWLSHK